MQTAKKIFLSLFFALCLSFNLQSVPVQAASTMWDTAKGGGIETIGSEAFGVSSGQEQDPRILVARLIKVVLGLLGIVFLVLIVLAGYKYMTAQGDSSQIEKAVDQIKHAAIGLVIILAAYSVTNFIIDEIYKAINRYD